MMDRTMDATENNNIMIDIDDENGLNLVEVSLDEDEEQGPSSEESRAHFENIVDSIDRIELVKIANDIVQKVQQDRDDRRPRDDQYAEGLRLTGLEEPAPGGLGLVGGSTVTHPMIAQACVDFSSRVMREIFPANGPVKAKILGEQNHEKIKKAQRKTEFMNWQCTEQIREFRKELEKAMTQVPLAGAHYFKLSWSSYLQRPVVENIPIDYLFIPFSASSFESAERVTHVLRLTDQEIKERYNFDGMLPDTDAGEISAAEAVNDLIEGRDSASLNVSEDGLKEIYEISVNLEVEGELCPYLITVEPNSRTVLALYRNWMPDDELKRQLEWIVELPCIPWRGAYPIGLVQLIGDLAKTATGSLRALLDSAAIQNMPTGFYLKGGPNGQEVMLRPGQLTQIDAGSTTDDIRKFIMPNPFAPPSPILAQLLDYVVKAAQETINIGMDKLADNNPNAPVGTTLALIEQGMVVFSEMHHRMHNAMARILQILHRVNQLWLDDECLARWDTGFKIETKDFDGVFDIIPVSDPRIFSEAQRFAQTQAIIQRAMQVPGLYDPRKVETLFLEQMKIAPETVLVPEPGSENLDPVSENVSISMGQRVAALPKQDHMAHLKVHIAYIQSPLMMDEVNKQKALYPLAMHLLEHIQQYYLTETHEAVTLAMDFDETVSDDADKQAEIILLAQQKIEQGLMPFMPIIQGIVEEAQKYKPQSPSMQNPAIDVERVRGEQRMQLEQFKASADQQSMQMQQQFDQQLEKMRQDFETQIEMIRQQAESERENAKLQLTSDLAVAELATGANVSNANGLPTGV